MSTRAEREKATKQNERHQAILAELLNDDSNKYCADCKSKGPRWASWNIGAFVCIRCAGIHRNLGVHISKMKSVNLDTWNPDQIESIRHKGNGVVNAMYESGLPDNFRRPTDDSGVEAFIRSKYERKQYYKKPDKAQAPASSSSAAPKAEKVKKEARKRSSQAAAAKTSKTTVNIVPRPSSSTAVSRTNSATPSCNSAAAPDLLGGFSASPAPSPAHNASPAAPSSSNDAMGAFIGAASTPANPDLFAGATQQQTDLFQNAPANAFAQQPQVAQPPVKDSIMQLYGGGGGGQGQAQMGMGGMMPGGMGMGGLVGNNGMSAGQMAYQQQIFMQQQMQQQVAMQQQMAMQQQQLAMQQQALQVSHVQEQMSRLRTGPGQANGQVGAGWPSNGQPQQQPGQTMNNSLWN